MDTKSGNLESTIPVNTEYEAPELTVIGDACDVVLGFAVGGFDGQFQMTEAGFEFELDGDQQ